jgi:hypothetical protein
MAITLGNTGFGGGDNSQGTSVGATLTVTSGSWVIVIARDTANLPSGVPTDTISTSYSSAISGGSDPKMQIFYGKAGSSGSITVTVPWSGGTSYPWVYAVEVQGLAAASPLDVADDTTGGSAGGTISADAISTAQADEFVLLACGQSAFSTFTAGTDFTLIDGDFPGNVANFGGVEYRITSGTLSSYVPTIAPSGGAGWTTVVAAFKGATGGGGGATVGKLGMLGVG